MRVAVAGSTGLIGTALCRALRERGDTVVRLVRDGSPPLDDDIDRSSVAIQWNPATGTIGEGLADVDAVVNLNDQFLGHSGIAAPGPFLCAPDSMLGDEDLGCATAHPICE